jgi:hypothetical protein
MPEDVSIAVGVRRYCAKKPSDWMVTIWWMSGATCAQTVGFLNGGSSVAELVHMCAERRMRPARF